MKPLDSYESLDQPRIGPTREEIDEVLDATDETAAVARNRFQLGGENWTPAAG